MALLGNFLCCLLVAWLCGPGLGVPLAPADRAPAVGEWTDRDCTGRWRGSAKSWRCRVRRQRGTGRRHTGHCGQRPDSKVTGSESWWGRPVGASMEPSRLLGVCLHPGSGWFSSQGRKVWSCCLVGNAAQNWLWAFPESPSLPRAEEDLQGPYTWM